MRTPPEIIVLLDKLFQGEALSITEKEKLKNWLFSNGIISSNEETLFENAGWEKDFVDYFSLVNNNEKIGQASQQFLSKLQPRSSVTTHSIFRKWAWVAASAVLVLGTAAVLFFNQRENSIASTSPQTEIAPGKEGAILTLADGSQIVLDSLGNGAITTENGIQVEVKEGKLVYRAATANVTSSTPLYHTMSTPKGRQYHLTLPDGTGVWLNASSSIKYPTTFSGPERRVEVFGEAYFEVAKMKDKPFRLNIADRAEVEVLGTHFNVNAYSNEKSIHTTLIEGSVKVKPLGNAIPSNAVVQLRPGQQAQIVNLLIEDDLNERTDQPIKVIDDADIDKVLAWKNGMFNFNNIDFGAAMRQLERWYDIDVVYENGIPEIELYGSMTKDVPLNDLLIGLDKIGVKCKLEGRRLLILRK